MLSFFDTVIDYFRVFFSFLSSIITGLLRGYMLIDESIVTTFFAMGFMPYLISASISLFLFIYIVKFIIGR